MPDCTILMIRCSSILYEFQNYAYWNFYESFIPHDKHDMSDVELLTVRKGTRRNTVPVIEEFVEAGNERECEK